LTEFSERYGPWVLDAFAAEVRAAPFRVPAGEERSFCRFLPGVLLAAAASGAR
jgi:hypothetical protein